MDVQPTPEPQPDAQPSGGLESSPRTNQGDEDKRGLQDAEAFLDMQRQVTLKMMAVELAQPGFPSIHALPRVADIPFVNLGHNVLLDYETLSSGLWATSFRLKQLFEQWHKKRMTRLKIIGVVAIFIGLTVAMIGGGSQGPNLGLGFIIALAVFGIGSLLLPSDHDMNNEARKIRRDAILKLQAGELPSWMLERSWLKGHSRIECGDGRVDGSTIPVLVATRNEPFPGYGRMQASQIFCCAPEKESSLDESDLTAKVTDAVFEAARSTRLGNVICGKVAVVDGDTIGQSSGWLDKTRSPLLTTTAKTPTEVRRVDPQASSRLFLAVQILFPEHLTAATFFVRVWKAGTAAAAELNLLTLGPPAHSDRYVRQRLHALRQSATRRARLERVTEQEEKPLKSYLGALLTAVRMGSEEELESLRKVPNLRKLEAFDSDESAEMRREAQKLRMDLTYWVGNWPQIQNWRESNSLTSTQDYFGEPESKAGIRTLYEQVSTGILDAFEELGFDVNQYRDEKGRLQINADQIDKLVVGEKIFMDDKQSKNQSESNAPSAAQSESTGSRAST